MKRRILVLPISAAVIFGLCLYKVTRPEVPIDAAIAVRSTMRQAPLFELFNPTMQPVRLKTYLGRHRMLIVFFDGRTGADRDPILQRLRRDYDRLSASDIIVMAVSEALPQENRKVIAETGEFPFSLLSDPSYAVHRAWGRFDEQSGQTLPGLFFIDRKGDVDWSGNVPQPLDNPMQKIDQLIAGN